jgi:glucan phosphoethanolaminetransferase (alkaline phosphatase superfamily)
MAFLHTKTKKRWLKWLSWLVMVCLVVPLIKLFAFFKVRKILAKKSETHEEWLAAYLRLEYGEDTADSASIKASDLTYLGCFGQDGRSVHYWQYPTSGKPAYVTVIMGESGDEASMTDELPIGDRLS